MKKILALFGSFNLLISTLTSIVGCSVFSSGTKTPALTVSENNIEIEKYTEKIVYVTNASQQSELSAVSSDSSILTVDLKSTVSGSIAITGVNVGTTTVVVSAKGTSSIAITVNVVNQTNEISVTYESGFSANVKTEVTETLTQLLKIDYYYQLENIKVSSLNGIVNPIYGDFGYVSFTASTLGYDELSISANDSKTLVIIFNIVAPIEIDSSSQITLGINDEVVITITNYSFLGDVKTTLSTGSEYVSVTYNSGKITIKAISVGNATLLLEAEFGLETKTIALKVINSDIELNSYYLNLDLATSGEESDVVTINNFDSISSNNLIATPNDATIAKAEINSNKITVTGLKNGSTKIIVSGDGLNPTEITVTIKDEIILNGLENGELNLNTDSSFGSTSASVTISNSDRLTDISVEIEDSGYPIDITAELNESKNAILITANNIDTSGWTSAGWKNIIVSAVNLKSIYFTVNLSTTINLQSSSQVVTVGNTVNNDVLNYDSLDKISVNSLDSTIVTATYNSSIHQIEVTGVKAGSTQIEVSATYGNKRTLTVRVT